MNLRRIPQKITSTSLYFEVKLLHGLLVVEDKLSMAHGLKKGALLDNDLVDFVNAP